MNTAAGPATIETLLAQGDAYAANADVKAAVNFYQAALKAAQSRALYATFSMVRNLPVGEAERRLDAIEKVAEVEFGGVVRRTFLTPFYFARRP